MFTPSNLNISYGKDATSISFGTYTNTTSAERKIKSLSLYLGSAIITNFGTEGTLGGHNGDGTPITITLKIGNTAYTSTVTVTTQITHITTTSTGNYPDKTQCAKYTFIFNDSPIIQPSGSVQIYWINRDSMTVSYPGAGQILTVGENYEFADEDASIPYVWKYVNGSWTKSLFIKGRAGSSWIDLESIHTYNNHWS